MLFAPFKTIFASLALVLSNLNKLVLVGDVVWFELESTLITVEGVSTAWSPTITPPLPSAWETI